MDLIGKNALVTGTSRGIGLHIAAGLAQRGARVLCHARRESDANRVAAKLHGVPVWGDLGSHAGVDAVAQQVTAAVDTLHVLVHNAGVLHRGGIDEVTPEAFDATIAVNVAAPLFLTQALLPQLRASGGARVVVVSSRVGQLSEGMSGGNMAYRMSKAAVNAMTANLSSELRRDHILVNSMHPGWVKTDMGGPSAPVEPEQGARAALFLASLPDDGPTGRFFQDEREILW